MQKTLQIGFVAVRDDKRIVLSISEYRGEKYIDLREFYLNKKGSYSPSKKGVSFDFSWLDSFVELIEELREI